MLASRWEYAVSMNVRWYQRGRSVIVSVSAGYYKQAPAGCSGRMLLLHGAESGSGLWAFAFGVIEVARAGRGDPHFAIRWSRATQREDHHGRSCSGQPRLSLSMLSCFLESCMLHGCFALDKSFACVHRHYWCGRRYERSSAGSAFTLLKGRHRTDGNPHHGRRAKTRPMPPAK